MLIWRVYVSGVELGRLNQSWVILGAGFVVMFFSGGSRFALGLMLKPMTEEIAEAPSEEEVQEEPIFDNPLLG